MPTLRLALAQLNLTVGDLEGNQRRIDDAIRQAAAWQADIVAVPELAVTGYPPEDLLLKPQFITANQRVLAALARRVPSSLAALVGFVDRDRQGRLYNAMAVLASGRHAATYRKRHLPNYGVFDEKRYFTPGSDPGLLELGGVRIGLTICEDLWEPQPCAVLADRGARLVINISASPYHADKLALREWLFAKRAAGHHLAVAYCNLIGGQDELVFDGGSLIFDARGRLLARGAQFREKLLVADLPLPSAAVGSLRGGASAVRLPHRWRERPLRQAPRPHPLGAVEEVYEALTLGLRDYARKNRFATLALGLSGGIDSALTACIAVDALGADRVVGVVMPSRFSSRGTQADARALAKALRIRQMDLSIEPVFRAYLQMLRPVFGAHAPDVTEQNIQARIRGNLLMALSNKFGWLVLTTGNKSEMATGYCTLYGDMAGGFAVIKDVPKMLVYRLAEFRNRRQGAPIPRRIFTRPPTAELAPHQTDQDTLPPYPALDRILKAYVEEDRSLEATVRRTHTPAAVVRRVVAMVDRSEYKRRQAPPGVKITPRAFGKDRRMPITNRYQEEWPSGQVAKWPKSFSGHPATRPPGH
ncbi:MAG: NAD+ synthase [Candidatus Omnitrophica bacterium]|nr:NAD+ synthase [Candidatus Omnitrophota bacterium]